MNGFLSMMNVFRKKEGYFLFPKTQPCYSRNVWHIILKIYCQTLTVWGQIDKNINLLCSRPRVTWKYWDNKIQYCQTVRGEGEGGEGKYNFPHCHQQTLSYDYYTKNDIKSWIGFRVNILWQSNMPRTQERPPVYSAWQYNQSLEYNSWQGRQINVELVVGLPDFVIIYWCGARG